MKRVGKSLCFLIVMVASIVSAGCYLFAPIDEQQNVNISLEPAILEIREGEDGVFNLVVEPSEMQNKVDVTYEVQKATLATVDGSARNAIVTAQVRGITKVYARTSGGVTAEALVNIRAPNGTTDVYLSASKRIFTASEGQYVTLSAKLEGGTVSEQDQITWTINDASIGTIIGAGGTALFQCKGTGNAIITVSHPRAPSALQIQVVAGGNDVQLALSAYAIAAVVGGNHAIEAIFVNRPAGIVLNESNIKWSLVAPEGETPIGYLVGSFGSKTTFYATSAGTQKVMAEYTNGSRAYCEIVVQLSEGLTVSQSGAVLAPTETREIDYVVSPPGAAVTLLNSNNDIATVQIDTNTKKILVTGKAEGATTATLRTGLKTTVLLSITCRWDKKIDTDVVTIVGEVGDIGEKEIHYTISPPTAAVTSITTNNAGIVKNIFHNPATGEIRFTASNEGAASITIVGNNGITRNISVIINGVGTVAFTPKVSGNLSYSTTLLTGTQVVLMLKLNSTGGMSIQPTPIGLAYTCEMTWTPVTGNNTIPTNRYSATIAPDQKSITFSYTNTPGFFVSKAGDLHYKATHTASGVVKEETMPVFFEVINTPIVIF